MARSVGDNIESNVEEEKITPEVQETNNDDNGGGSSNTDNEPSVDVSDVGTEVPSAEDGGTNAPAPNPSGDNIDVSQDDPTPDDVSVQGDPDAINALLNGTDSNGNEIGGTSAKSGSDVYQEQVIIGEATVETVAPETTRIEDTPVPTTEPVVEITDPPTEPETEPAPTVVPTEAPTVAPTEAPTEAPTVPPTESETEPETEPAPTEAPTVPPTEPETEPTPTDAPTVPPTEPETEHETAPTPTDAPTTPPTEPEETPEVTPEPDPTPEVTPAPDEPEPTMTLHNEPPHAEGPGRKYDFFQTCMNVLAYKFHFPVKNLVLACGGQDLLDELEAGGYHVPVYGDELMDDYLHDAHEQSVWTNAWKMVLGDDTATDADRDIADAYIKDQAEDVEDGIAVSGDLNADGVVDEKDAAITQSEWDVDANSEAPHSAENVGIQENMVNSQWEAMDSGNYTGDFDSGNGMSDNGEPTSDYFEGDAGESEGLGINGNNGQLSTGADGNPDYVHTPNDHAVGDTEVMVEEEHTNTDSLGNDELSVETEVASPTTEAEADSSAVADDPYATRRAENEAWLNGEGLEDVPESNRAEVLQERHDSTYASFENTFNNYSNLQEQIESLKEQGVSGVAITEMEKQANAWYDQLRETPSSIVDEYTANVNEAATVEREEADRAERNQDRLSTLTADLNLDSMRLDDEPSVQNEGMC